MAKKTNSNGTKQSTTNAQVEDFFKTAKAVNAINNNVDVTVEDQVIKIEAYDWTIRVHSMGLMELKQKNVQFLDSYDINDISFIYQNLNTLRSMFKTEQAA